MGGGTAVHIIAFTVGGKAAVKFASIPRGQTPLDVAGRGGERVIALAIYFVWGSFLSG